MTDTLTRGLTGRSEAAHHAWTLVLLLLAGGGVFATWGSVRSSAVGWTSAEVIGALVAGESIIGLFLWWEHRTRDPMLPLALFRRTRFRSANAVSFFMCATTGCAPGST
jgi:hypothetical protein